MRLAYVFHRKRLINDIHKRRKAFHLQLLLKMRESVLQANESLELLFNMENGFIPHSKGQSWLSVHAHLYSRLLRFKLKDSDLEASYLNEIRKFKTSYDSIEDLRDHHNQTFITQELHDCEDLFSSVESRSLDQQQRKAIVYDEDNNLVIAGAGAGKTTTIIGKLQYLIQRKGVLPSKILLLSFTRKAVENLIERAPYSGLQAMTFHKLALEIIARNTGVKPNIFDPAKFETVIRYAFRKLCNDVDYAALVAEFVANYTVSYKSPSQFQDESSYIAYLKSIDNRSIRMVSKKVGKERTTLRREVMKSQEECAIANFLFLNGIEYEYERRYPFHTATTSHSQYRPDFTITQGDITIYLEHFGVDENGNVPKWFEGRNSQKSYQSGMEWKRKCHKLNGTTLVETYSYQMLQDTLIPNLRRELESHGIKFQPKSPREVFREIHESSATEFDDLISFFQTYISLLKANRLSIEQLSMDTALFEYPCQMKRANLFFKIIEPILHEYNELLQTNSELDFNDLINEAVDIIESGNDPIDYEYIIVDEFQDISLPRHKLIKALRDVSSYCRTYCVGDDWQSIYRFAGSDIGLMVDFEEHYGFTNRSKVETTYRFGNPLLEVSAEFVLKNPRQLRKELRPFQMNRNTSFEVIQGSSLIYPEMVRNMIAKFKADHGSDSSVLILSRYSYDFDVFKNSLVCSYRERDGLLKFNTDEQKGEELSATCLTVHKAKGLEADFTILIRCNAGRNGFPSSRSDDELLRPLLSRPEDYPNSEERRLFYVALTRARKKTCVVYDSYAPSVFLRELPDTDPPEDICPKCKEGRLFDYRKGTHKDGKKWSIRKCSNYNWGCSYEWKSWDRS